MPYNINLFHADNFLEFWDSVKGQQSIRVVYEEDGVEKGRLVGLLFSDSGIKGYLSRRCIVWGGPVISDDVLDRNKVFEILMISFIEKLKGKTIYIEFRNIFDCSDFNSLFNSYGFQFCEHLNFISLLDNEDSVKKRINRSKMQQIKKSLNSGAEIIETRDVSEISEFYKLLTELYKKKVKTPLPRLDYFLNLSKYNVGIFLLIKFQNKIIGGLIIGAYNEVVYAIYSCGEDGKYKDVYPSVLAFWGGLEYGLKNGLKYFDFLGAGKPNEDYGVREFKSKFGGELVNYGRYSLVLNKVLFAIGKFGVKILKKYT
jgi:serine/alanine adding enzyme